MGVRFIGGCCGFELYYIWFIVEEVWEFFNDIFCKSKIYKKMLLKVKFIIFVICVVYFGKVL